jgi:hypothetical protein
MSETERRAELAVQLRQAAERCCQCTDGHHDWIPTYPYGTDGDVRMTRDLARELADLLTTTPADRAPGTAEGGGGRG